MSPRLARRFGDLQSAMRVRLVQLGLVEAGPRYRGPAWARLNNRNPPAPTSGRCRRSRDMYGINGLHAMATARGLLQRPTRSRLARPMHLSRFARMLHNRYYIGKVTYRGVEY